MGITQQSVVLVNYNLLLGENLEASDICAMAKTKTAKSKKAKERPAWSIRFEMAMVAAGFDQPSLAKRMHVTQQTVSSWVVGRTSPNFERLSLFCELTNTTADWIIRKQGPMPDHAHDSPPSEKGRMAG